MRRVGKSTNRTIRQRRVYIPNIKILNKNNDLFFGTDHWYRQLENEDPCLFEWDVVSKFVHYNSSFIEIRSKTCPYPGECLCCDTSDIPTTLSKEKKNKRKKCKDDLRHYVKAL